MISTAAEILVRSVIRMLNLLAWWTGFLFSMILSPLSGRLVVAKVLVTLCGLMELQSPFLASVPVPTMIRRFLSWVPWVLVLPRSVVVPVLQLVWCPLNLVMPVVAVGMVPLRGMRKPWLQLGPIPIPLLSVLRPWIPARRTSLTAAVLLACAVAWD